ncbi:lysozyme inhibitor LprI family protein [Anianabacter salinae]|uniref:lysozyme inhibitor LprI family protein n=1 Tax=Anianabacter salinae TaxID=2851023 RepID=UPI00225DCDCA|nr:lysozyme inhibitor LprI family protein [Anianabacter salinae]MBV0911416.1 DUF1311 domain-containing protein [Anianabacter salinae]
MIRLTFLLSLLAAPVAAQELIFSGDTPQWCLDEAAGEAERRDCIGVAASACMEDTPGGGSTAGMSGCLDLERAYWDDRLNAVYQDLLASDRADDADYGGPNLPSKAEALRDMQRAWIAYRDGRCDYEYSQWGGGTGGGPAILGCLMQLTGEQVLYLEATLDGY